MTMKITASSSLDTAVVTRNSEKDVAFIAVMGMTGSAKTSFIKTATGNSDLVVGHSLNACKYESFREGLQHLMRP